MATLDAKKAYKNFCKKGFKESPNNSPDHKYIEFWHEGKVTSIRTKFSHGKKEIDKSLIGIMSRQIRLQRADFINFAQCRISEEEYIEKMKSTNHL